MKKLFILGLSVAMIAGASSCKKTSKGKVSNDWVVTSSTSSSNNNSGWKSETVETDTEYTTTTVQMISGTEVETIEKGTNSNFTYVINKDGSFSYSKTQTEGTVNGVAVVNPETTKETGSGTWSFVGKNKTGEFKKNERIMFTLLESSTTDSNGTSSDTYKDIDGSIWLVESSKKKELVLKYDYENVTNPTSGSSYTYNYSSTMTLTQK